MAKRGLYVVGPTIPATARGASTVRRVIGLLSATALLLAACASGPSLAALERNELPSTTTTTEAAPEGVTVVIIDNGRFTPQGVVLDLEVSWIVEFRNQDPPRAYQIVSRDNGDDGEPLFQSETLAPGDSFQMDFSAFPPDVYRYSAFLGNQRIPGQVDTRPSR
ncbi:MAG: hypothetical protein AAB198_07390 [Actinomycetota bacterium]